MSKKLQILVANDDGVHSPGIAALAKAFSKMGSTLIVAPMEERSISGHALTMHKPLRMRMHKKAVYSVSGGPADCIYLGINEALKKRLPDLVVSGVNRGGNLGQDVYYSGTISAAREAAILGVPAVAVSLNLNPNDWRQVTMKLHFDVAAKIAEEIVKKTLYVLSGKKNIQAGLKNWPYGMVLNINVPNLPLSKIKGCRLAHQGQRTYSSAIIKRQDMRKRNYYWIGGTYLGFKKQKNTDSYIINEKYVAITPLQLDCTDHSMLAKLGKVFKY